MRSTPRRGGSDADAAAVARRPGQATAALQQWRGISGAAALATAWRRRRRCGGGTSRASHRRWPQSLGTHSRAARYVRAACDLWSTPCRGGGVAAKVSRRQRLWRRGGRRRWRGGGMIRASHRQWPRSLGARSRAARHVRAACGLWSTPRRGGGGAAKAPRRRRRGGGITIAASRRRRCGGGGGAAAAVAARRRRDPRVASAAAAVARVPPVTCAWACGPRRIAAAAVRRRRRGGGVVVTMSRRRQRGGGEVAAAARWRRDPRLASAAPRHQRGWDHALALCQNSKPLGHSALRGAAAHLLWWYGESEAERCFFNFVYWPAQLVCFWFT